MKKNILIRPVQLIIAGICLIAMVDGCYYFKVNRTIQPDAGTLQKVQNDQKFVILHLDDQLWHFTQIEVSDDSISGKIIIIYGHDTYKEATPDVPNRYRKYEAENMPEVMNEVHIYTTEMTNTGLNSVSVPVKAITKIDIYDKDKKATVASWGLTMLGVAAATTALVGIIVLLTKESCPFIYTYNGTDFIFTGEVFSGAVQPGLERDDYLLIPSIHPDDGSYRLKITNEVNEIQYVNLAELVVFDHPSSTSVLIDKNGTIYSFGTPSPPVEARSIGNTDILPLLEEKDSACYMGIEKEMDESGIDELTLKFIRPENATSARLIIRAKNTFWLDGLVQRIDRLFGKSYASYSARQEKVSGNKLKKWQLSQKLPLSVWLERNGEWEFSDYFNIAGAMALREDILPLDLSGVTSDTIKLKLVTGFLFWEIDYVAMDFGTNDIVSLTFLQPATATSNNGKSVKELILDNDTSWYLLDKVGDEALITFDAPVEKDSARSVFLHTRGYYKILMDQQGEPDVKRLRPFRKPDRMPAFSKEMFDSLANK